MLEVRNLCTQFPGKRGIVRAADDVNLEISRGETVGIIGESGSGKSVTVNSIVRLVPPPGRTVRGEVLLDGIDLLKLSYSEIRRIRGKRIAIVFQDPTTYLNPLMKIGDQITEVIMTHLGKSRSEAWEMATKSLESVGIPQPSTRVSSYPHQLSGGMKQRALIAIAIATNPDLIIADEPTSALDVLTQTQILDLLKLINRQFKMSILLITHDVNVVASLCTRLYVMYAGQIVEEGTISQIMQDPKHPYTQGLIQSIPKLTSLKFTFIPGNPPELDSLPSGCRFHPRCPQAWEKCREFAPSLVKLDDGGSVRCFLYGEPSSAGPEC